MDVVIACSVEKEADGEYSLDEMAIIDDAMFKTIDLDEDIKALLHLWRFPVW